MQSQTMAKEQWELIIVDNHSEKRLESALDLRWHPAARVIREEDLGLTPARVRGIREAQAELLVFVDDDNVLADDYVQQAVEIGNTWPILGAWGGSIGPWFETEPSKEARLCLDSLTLREVREISWSNFTNRWDRLPWGAGLCVRRAVALKWASRAAMDSIRRGLGRRGTSLLSQEDTDLALTACDLGLGTGIFPALELTHLIPSCRLESHYLRKLAESISYSMTMLQAIRGSPPKRPSFRQRIHKLLPALRQGLWPFQLHLAAQRGFSAALKDWQKKRLGRATDEQ